MTLKSKQKNVDLWVYSASLSYLLEYKGLFLSLISSPSRSSSIWSVVESENVLLRSFSILLLAQILRRLTLDAWKWLLCSELNTRYEILFCFTPETGIKLIISRNKNFQSELRQLLRVFRKQLAWLVVKFLCLFTAANREGILLATYASLASLARRNWRWISE